MTLRLSDLPPDVRKRVADGVEVAHEHERQTRSAPTKGVPLTCCHPGCGEVIANPTEGRLRAHDGKHPDAHSVRYEMVAR